MDANIHIVLYANSHGMYHISAVKRKRILDMTPDYMAGKVTIYAVARDCGVEFSTARRYLERYSAQVQAQVDVVVERMSQNPKKSLKSRIIGLVFGGMLNEKPEAATTQ